MPRKVVPLVTGEKYHIYNRGTEKRNIFKDKADYLRFYRSLDIFNTKEPVGNYRLGLTNKVNKSESLVKIDAYSLLPNHFHLLLEQRLENGISEFMKRVSAGYTGYFNSKYERTGVLFQGKFKRVLIKNDEQYQYLFAYINENHFVHSIERRNEVCFSSSLHYQGKFKSKIINEEKEYSFSNSVDLAKHIYEQRKSNLRLLET